jgi:hypothetical protein
MASTPANTPDPKQHRSDLVLVWQFLTSERVRYVVSWLAALIGLSICLHESWHLQDNPRRPDGCDGHVGLDYSGQWLMGHLLVRGQGMHLYDRRCQRNSLIEAYPLDMQEPKKKKSDVRDIMYSMMGDDDEIAANTALGSYLAPLGANGPLGAVTLTAAATSDPERARLAGARCVGGPLYPPINALFSAPLGMLSPLTGFRLYQVVSIFLLIGVAAGMGLLTHGRVWVPVIIVVLLLVPGPDRSISLGQNAVFSLAILVWGWVLVARGRLGWGGVVWGLLAYKPVWAMAFFMVPVLTRRWRMALAMFATGAGLAVLTLPFVGVHGWLDWLAMGPEVTTTYNTDENWIQCSRDLLGMPRRWLLNFPEDQRGSWLLPALIGWGLWTASLEITLRIAFLRWRRPATVDGPSAAFLMLGAWLGCFHFMHYDVFLAALPIMLLFTDPRSYLEPVFVAILPLRTKLMNAGLLRHYQPRLATEVPSPMHVQTGPGTIWVLNRMAPTLLVAFMWSHTSVPRFGDSYVAWDTICVMTFWAWCGWMSLKENR